MTNPVDIPIGLGSRILGQDCYPIKKNPVGYF
jgi:hypothetical protein